MAILYQRAPDAETDLLRFQTSNTAIKTEELAAPVRNGKNLPMPVFCTAL